MGQPPWQCETTSGGAAEEHLCKNLRLDRESVAGTRLISRAEFMKALLSPFAVRLFNEEDLDELDRIEQLSGEASWSRTELELFAGRLDVDVRVITPREAPECPVGFFAVEHGDETLYLANLAVHPEWRRKGIATLALDAVVEMGRSLQYQWVALDVQEENLVAQFLYRSAGFRAVRLCREHYAGQDGYHMVKEIGVTAKLR